MRRMRPRSGAAGLGGSGQRGYGQLGWHGPGSRRLRHSSLCARRIPRGCGRRRWGAAHWARVPTAAVAREAECASPRAARLAPNPYRIVTLPSMHMPYPPPGPLSLSLVGVAIGSAATPSSKRDTIGADLLRRPPRMQTPRRTPVLEVGTSHQGLRRARSEAGVPLLGFLRLRHPVCLLRAHLCRHGRTAFACHCDGAPGGTDVLSEMRRRSRRHQRRSGVRAWQDAALQVPGGRASPCLPAGRSRTHSQAERTPTRLRYCLLPWLRRAAPPAPRLPCLRTVALGLAIPSCRASSTLG